MILNLLRHGGDPLEILLILLLTVPIMLFATSVHETAHGFVAKLFGDNTAYNLGRLTLNPIKHVDPIGLISLLIFGYGWAKPVPINTRNFKNQKWGMAITALAGPVSNLLMGVFCAVATGVILGIYSYLTWINGPAFWITFTDVLSYACFYGALVNFVYMTFNMIPVPPFDGSRVALVFLPTKTYFAIMRYERQIMIGTLVALMVLSYFNFSPFGIVAQKLLDLIYVPVANGTVTLLLNILH